MMEYGKIAVRSAEKKNIEYALFLCLGTLLDVWFKKQIEFNFLI
jgi:hypothetical protein